jgi:DNA-binding MarR family transcriptional regulator
MRRISPLDYWRLLLDSNRSLSAIDHVATVTGVERTPEDMVDALARIVFGGVALTTVALDHASKGRDLTFTQWWAIAIVGESDSGLRVGEVARSMNAALQGTSHLLRRLEDRGLLSLTRDEKDRRATVAQLSPDGARLRAAVMAHRRELLAGMARSLDPSAPADEVLGELARRFAAYRR